MKMNFNMPVRIISGIGCIAENPELFKLGRRCIIVTGRNSAKICGALDDVLSVLEKNQIEYIIFDKIRENPMMNVCCDGGKKAREFGAEFVIGIGGGSPLDASKAIAAYAANDIVGSEIFKVSEHPSLPIIAVPTTAGTGSEVNRYSVLTIDGENKKKTFTSDYSYPKYSFLDSKYTYSLGKDYTVSTALDAFCHCTESYLSPKSTEISSMLAINGAEKIWNVLRVTDTDEYTPEMRETLMNASCMAGIAINTTGTGFPHPLGYSLTLSDYAVSHGRACGTFMGEYIAYNMRTCIGKQKIFEICDALDTTADEISEFIPKLADIHINLSDGEIRSYVEKVRGAGNYSNSPYVINYDEMLDIYSKLFG